MPQSLGHGSYHIVVKDRVIISESFGSWNDVTIRNFIKEYQTKATPLLGELWAGIVDVSQWQLATNEAELIAKDFEQWCIKHNRAYVAIVGGTSLTNFQLSRSGLGGSVSQTNILHVPEQHQAMEWLHQLGFVKTIN